MELQARRVAVITFIDRVRTETLLWRVLEALTQHMGSKAGLFCAPLRERWYAEDEKLGH